MKIIVYDTADGRLNIRGARTAKFLAKFDGDDAAAVQDILDNRMPPDALNVQVLDNPTFPSNRTYRNAWEVSGMNIKVNMPKAREIHAKHIAVGQTAGIARLKVEERNERLKSNTTQADSHAADLVALEALDLNVLATQIAAAPNPTALSAIWPALVSR